MAKPKVVGAKLKGMAWEPDARQLEMYALRVRGRHTWQEIGEAFGVTYQAVQQQVGKVNDWLIPQHLAEITQIKVEHIEALLVLRREAMLAWDKSKDDGPGDPRYLESARKFLEDIRKITGADAPIRIHSETEVRLAGVERDDAKREMFDRLTKIGQWGKN